MDSMHEILDELAHSTERSILATVIKVEGSAYRKEGTSMLFTEDKRQIGIISAGCLETDLAIQADNLLNEANSHSRTLIYDMRAEDDLSWGRGAGCNGTVHILLEKVGPELRDQLCTVKNHLDQGTPVISLKVLKKDTVRTIFVTKNQHIFGHEESLSEQVIRFAQQKEKSCMQYMDDLESNVYIHHFKPKARLFIFGAGPDVRPLASIAARTGFSVKIWDWRPAYLDRSLFPEASFLKNKSISATLENSHFTAGDSVIIMTHDFQKDKELLQSLLKYRQVSYLGILGPCKRTTRLLNGAVIPEQLHSPVGLAIGADGPEEIAISIIADLIKAQRQLSREMGGFFEKNRDSRYLSSGGTK